MPVHVIKVPLSTERVSKEPDFQHFETDLYLGLLENTNKVKPGLPPILLPKINIDMTKPPPVYTPPVKDKVTDKYDHPSNIPDKYDPDPTDESDEESMPEDIPLPEEFEDLDDDSEDDVVKKVGIDTTTPKTPSFPQNTQGPPPQSSQPPSISRDVSQPAQPSQEDPYAGLSQEEREMKEKRDYLLKFDKIKIGLQDTDEIEIPPYGVHSDLRDMKYQYEYVVKNIDMKKNLSSYRMYLMGGFGFVEWLATQHVGIDMSNFAKEQCKLMNQYDHLLIELGERSYSQWSSSLPVEFRILFLVLFNAAVFYLAKSGILAGIFANLYNPTQTDKPKMKGPKPNY